MDSVIIAYQNWLSSTSFKWDTFLHLTTSSPTSIKGFKRKIERFLEYAGGWGFFGFEYGKFGGVLHVHGIVEGREREIQDVWYWWFKRYGRNLIQEIKPELKARGIRYICKYALKDGNFEILGKRNKNLLTSQLLLCNNRKQKDTGG